MMIANVSQGNAVDLPQALRTAQDAIRLPEVQEMLRRLSAFKLGIFMPHMHNEHTGEFQALPDEITQVESGLEVSFQASEEIASQTDRFLPVGWSWRAGTASVSAACEMVQDETAGYPKHKMLETSQEGDPPCHSSATNERVLPCRIYSTLKKEASPCITKL